MCKRTLLSGHLSLEHHERPLVGFSYELRDFKLGLAMSCLDPPQVKGLSLWKCAFLALENLKHLGDKVS